MHILILIVLLNFTYKKLKFKDTLRISSRAVSQAQGPCERLVTAVFTPSRLALAAQLTLAFVTQSPAAVMQGTLNDLSLTEFVPSVL